MYAISEKRYNLKDYSIQVPKFYYEYRIMDSSSGSTVYGVLRLLTFESQVSMGST